MGGRVNGAINAVRAVVTCQLMTEEGVRTINGSDVSTSSQRWWRRLEKDAKSPGVVALLLELLLCEEDEEEEE